MGLIGRIVQSSVFQNSPHGFRNRPSGDFPASWALAPKDLGMSAAFTHLRPWNCAKLRIPVGLSWQFGTVWVRPKPTFFRFPARAREYGRQDQRRLGGRHCRLGRRPFVFYSPQSRPASPARCSVGQLVHEAQIVGQVQPCDLMLPVGSHSGPPALHVEGVSGRRASSAHNGPCASLNRSRRCGKSLGNDAGLFCCGGCTVVASSRSFKSMRRHSFHWEGPGCLASGRSTERSASAPAAGLLLCFEKDRSGRAWLLPEIHLWRLSPNVLAVPPVYCSGFGSPRYSDQSDRVAGRQDGCSAMWSHLGSNLCASIPTPSGSGMSRADGAPGGWTAPVGIAIPARYAVKPLIRWLWRTIRTSQTSRRYCWP